MANGIVERVPIHEEESKTRYFLPHHGVVRADKETTKLHMVFDGSAKANQGEFSLNECLEKGPNMTPHIFDILLRFRSHKVGIIADIEKAFHQVVIDKRDRDFLRFLWFENITNNRPSIIQHRFTRLMFGLTPSAAILNGVIQTHLTRYLLTEPTLSKQLAEGFYVDDFTGGAEAVQEGLNVYEKAKELMRKGGFNLRKWHTNSADLQQRIDYLENVTLSETSSTQVKILGMSWDTKEDYFCFEFGDVVLYMQSLPPTRRSVLRLSAKIFDPLGLLSPFVISIKILFQTSCKSKLQWDDRLDGSLLEEWVRLEKDLVTLSQIRVPRCYYIHKQDPILQELHGFSDASERAYAAVVYLRSVYSDGEVVIRIVASKTRVAPLKGQTIPRLELLGATILARLVNAVLLSVKFRPRVYYWTDSYTVLCWVKNEKQWKQYVQHRVDEIHKLSSKDSWRFCPGQCNPADVPSRSCSAMELSKQELWWNGPKYLEKTKDNWPNLPTTNDSKAAEIELAKSAPEIVYAMVLVTNKDRDTVNLEALFDIQRYSTKLKLLRITGWVLKFISLIKYTGGQPRQRGLDANHLREAELIWLKSIQRHAFPAEYKKLLSSKYVVYNSQLILFLDNGIIRCRGRINNADLLANAKNPVLLPEKHQFSRLLIQEKHQLVHHNGVRDTLAATRQDYWILKGRKIVKNVIRHCVVCRRYEGKSYSTPLIPDLPIERVSTNPPFSNIGVDFAGPLYIRDNQSSDNTCKIYICLFTCASTRALHLEIVRDLSASTFLRAFRRFCGRRGVPTNVMLDNAKTF